MGCFPFESGQTVSEFSPISFGGAKAVVLLDSAQQNFEGFNQVLRERSESVSVFFKEFLAIKSEHSFFLPWELFVVRILSAMLRGRMVRGFARELFDFHSQRVIRRGWAVTEMM
jgi:hypothetical protein